MASQKSFQYSLEKQANKNYKVDSCKWADIIKQLSSLGEDCESSHENSIGGLEKY